MRKPESGICGGAALASGIKLVKSNKAMIDDWLVVKMDMGYSFSKIKHFYLRD
jgi:hypothetical protein